MDIVVNDTNIFIDLYLIDLLDDFFALPFNFHTIDFVLAEITDQNQLDALKTFLEEGKLFVKKHSEKELQQIIELQSSCNGNLSITDCAVCQYALLNDYFLLTGDRQLRSSAISSGVSVYGIIFIFNKLIDYKIITKNVAADKLESLSQLNKRLPKSEIDKLITCWRK